MRVNEIFYSLQGEGYNTGTAAVFVRLAGCNLKCPFCDTDFKSYVEMTEDEIVDEVAKYRTFLVVITGGEPTLQLTELLVAKLHRKHFKVAIETNGTRPVPQNVDWVTVSPKQEYVGASGTPTLKVADEVKVVFDGVKEISDYGIAALYYYVQPCDTGDAERNAEIINQCVEFIKKNPKWKLSLQTQKILNVR